MILSDFGGPGAHCLMIFGPGQGSKDAWRPTLTISWIFVILRTFSVRKSTSFLRSKCDLLQCCFSMVFWVITFLVFLWCGVPGGSILGGIWRSFWWHFWWPAISWFLLPLLYETLIFEGWRAPKLHHFWWLFWGCSQGGLWNTIFYDFERFWAPNGRPFGSKKASKNETKKRAPKRRSRLTQVTGCGPLKNTQIPDLGPRDDGTEHALACLAARWRIYIYIYTYTHTHTRT